MHLGRGRLILLAVLLLLAAGAGTVLQAEMTVNAERPGPPASIVFSTMLPQYYPPGYILPTMAVDPSGRIYLGGTGIEILAADHRHVVKLASLPRRLLTRNNMPGIWARTIEAGGGTVAAVADAGGHGIPFLEKGGARIHPFWAGALVAWTTMGSRHLHAVELGGSCNQSPWAVTGDSHGDILVAGVTNSSNFPVVRAAQPAFAGPHASPPACPPSSYQGLQDGDVFLTRLDPKGTITFSTYLGGSGADDPSAVATDAAGNMYVAGLTYSSDFPRVRAFMHRGLGPVCYRDSHGEPHYCWRDFVAKFSRAGQLAWVTMLPLGSLSGDVTAMTVSRGSVYLVGYTVSVDLPTVHAAQPASGGGSCTDYDGASISCRDAWVIKLTRSGHIAFETYLGGSGDDVGAAVAAAPDGSIYVGGTTDSTGDHFPDVWYKDFPRIRTVRGAPGGIGRCALPTPCGDAFLARFSPAGVLEGSWAFGGSGDEQLTSLGIDRRGHIYLSGDTDSCDLPIRHGSVFHPYPHRIPHDCNA